MATAKTVLSLFGALATVTLVISVPTLSCANADIRRDREQRAVSLISPMSGLISGPVTRYGRLPNVTLKRNNPAVTYRGRASFPADNDSKLCIHSSGWRLPHSPGIVAERRAQCRPTASNRRLEDSRLIDRVTAVVAAQPKRRTRRTSTQVAISQTAAGRP
jgi:hypothetical protein